MDLQVNNGILLRIDHTKKLNHRGFRNPELTMQMLTRDFCNHIQHAHARQYRLTRKMPFEYGMFRHEFHLDMDPVSVSLQRFNYIKIIEEQVPVFFSGKSKN